MAPLCGSLRALQGGWLASRRLAIIANKQGATSLTRNGVSHAGQSQALSPCQEPSMDLNDQSVVSGPTIQPAAAAAIRQEGGNGHLNGHSFGMHELLHALQAMRIGDFSVRLPSELDRPGRQDRRYLQRDRCGQRADGLRAGACGQVVGREGKTRTRVKFGLQSGAWARDGGLGQRPDRRPAVAHHGGDARDHRGGAGRSAADRAARCRRPAAAGRVPAAGDHRQHDDQAALACSPRR